MPSVAAASPADPGGVPSGFTGGPVEHLDPIAVPDHDRILGRENGAGDAQRHAPQLFALFEIDDPGLHCRRDDHVVLAGVDHAEVGIER